MLGRRRRQQHTGPKQHVTRRTRYCLPPLIQTCPIPQTRPEASSVPLMLPSPLEPNWPLVLSPTLSPTLPPTLTPTLPASLLTAVPPQPPKPFPTVPSQVKYNPYDDDDDFGLLLTVGYNPYSKAPPEEDVVEYGIIQRYVMAYDFHDDCAICVEAFSAGNVLSVTPCGHKFCAGCLDDWVTMNPSCPLCRRDFL